MAKTDLATTTEILDQLIGFPTVSADSNLELIDYVADRLENAGAQVKVSRDATGAKANLFATLGPDTDGGIVLSGHTDVVPADASEWARDPFQMRVADGLLFGRGACDMKGFIAAALAKAPAFAQLDLKRPLHFAFTYDEEVGCFGARHLVEDLRQDGLKPAVAIIGEPTEMRVIEGHKGCYEYTTRIHGTDGHGSQPDNGVNAIHVAARYVAHLLQLGEDLKRRAAEDSARFTPPWTTVQVGRIEGGSARNVIARHCSVEWEMRPVRPDDASFVKDSLHQFIRTELLPEMRKVYSEAEIVTEIIGEVEGLQVMDTNEARDIVTRLTGANFCDVVAFGTEAGLFQSLGMSVVICGPGSIAQAHQPDEFVSLDQLQACLTLLDGLKRPLTMQQKPS